MDAKESSKIKRISRQQEKRAANDIGGKTQAASGATKFGGADVRVQGKYRVECKFTNKSSYILKLTELEKLKKQANASLEYPIFQFCLRSHLGKLEKPYAVIPWVNSLDPSIEIKALSKQVSLSRDFLDTVEYGKPVKISFQHPPFRSYRLMPWDELVNNLQQESNA